MSSVLGEERLTHLQRSAVASEHLDMDVVDYVPTYRSADGTGGGIGIAKWT